MMEQAVHPGRAGWTQEEIDTLWKEIQSAAENGAPLRGVFERTGQALGRKPNSVRNYYYMQLRDQAGPACRRAAPFETFTPEEIHDLLRKVLSGQGKGLSVRSCVMELSGGDRTLMLRYQNKYRSILRKKPALIQKVCDELRREGLPCPSPAEKEAPSAPPAAFPGAADPDVSAALRAISALARRAARNDAPESDRLKVQRDLLLMQLEDLQLAARELIRDCKQFLGDPPENQAVCLPDFSAALASRIARLESLSG